MALRLQTLVHVGLFACTSLVIDGCSFLFTSSPSTPADKVTSYSTVDCSTSDVAPALDAIGSGIETVVAIGYVSQAESPEPAAVALMLFWTGLYSASAIYGFNNTSECAEARARRDELMARELQNERMRHWAPGYPPQQQRYSR